MKDYERESLYCQRRGAAGRYAGRSGHSDRCGRQGGGAVSGGAVRRRTEQTESRGQKYKYGDLAHKQATVAALLHDVCKIDCYHVTNKDGGAKYTYSDPLPLGHGEKSVMLLLQHGFKLTEVEMLAIRWHMGAYRDRDARELDAAQRIPLVLHLHLADMMASRWEGRQCGTN